MSRFLGIGDVITAVIAACLFTLVNVAGGIVNDKLGYAYGLNHVPGTLLFQLAIAGVYVLISMWQVRLRKSFRWPLIRLFFWIAIMVIGTGDMDGFMYATNSNFCFFLSTLSQSLGEQGAGIRFEILVILVGITLYQVLIFELAEQIQRKFFRKGKPA